ncbi:serine protease, putative [Rubellimicrobium mesophilum DSM 19309]|uniref:Serine protease, putative n=1 Tax=Rubellimicrobium mesophilum DSM 19309 TaxID=442562 RepID=A0A017HQV8_9RHOB|nr:trypsin-like peptidase domain-containing protein [Rubellimicrobium mesophilum]EYD76129.1 serine protease, putative [Rubellimicrobium mesophilum DSM 19309]
MIRGLLVGAILALVLGLGIGLGIGASGWLPEWLPVARQESAPPVAPVPPAELVVAPEGSEERANIDLFQRARDSVVAISTSAARRGLFGAATTEVPLGTGSGWVWDGEGHILTNAHVIQGASSASVQLADGRAFDARLVGADTVHDLAVLQIEGEDLPAPLSLAPPEPPQVGTKVLAIGNPFGLDWTLTTGIVSALERELPGDQAGAIRRGLIQTDAAINPGNSGGPLLNSAGQVIGVNTAIYSPSGGSAGIGFAIPAATVGRVVPELIRTGHYSPPTLGLLFDARINSAVNRQGLDGVLVLDVPRGSEAETAGVEAAQFTRDGRIVPGSVITAVEGEPVATLDDLLADIDARQPGEEVAVTFETGGKETTVEMALVAGE